MPGNWFANSALFALLVPPVAVLLNNYFDSKDGYRSGGLFRRAPTNNQGSNVESPACRGGDTIYAEGGTRFSEINPNGGWGWQIGPVTPSNECFNTNLWAGAGQQYKTTSDRFAGFATICYNTNNTLNIFLYGALQQPVLCDISIYVGYIGVVDAIGGTSPGQYTCLGANKNECKSDGPTNFLQFTRNGLNGNTTFIVIHAVYCTSACANTCVPSTTTNFLSTTSTTTTTTTTTEFVTQISTAVTTFETTQLVPTTITEAGTERVVTATIQETITKTETFTSIGCNENCYFCEGDYCKTTVTELLPGTTVLATKTLTTTDIQPTTKTLTVVIEGEPTIVTQVSLLTETKTQLTTETATVCSTDVVHPTPTCIDIGLAAPFNAYTFEDYQGSSDVQGRLLVGGDANITDGFSVGDQLSIIPCTEATVIVGGRLFGWLTGRNYFGNIIVGEPSFIGPVIDPGCIEKPVVNPTFFNFTKANFQLMNANAFMCTLHSNYKSLKVEYGTLSLSFLGNLPFEIVEINDGNFFNGVVSYIEPLDGFKPGSVLIFNIKGKNAGIANINMENLANIPVIFNFCEAEHLVIKNVAVRGWVIAPYANVHDATGVIWGSIFVKSLSGSIQVNIGIIPICVYDNPTRYVYYADMTLAKRKNDAERYKKEKTLRKLKRSFGEKDAYQSVPVTPISRPHSREKLSEPNHQLLKHFEEEERELIKEQLARNEVFFGHDNLEKIKSSFVIVVGLGGVGSHAAVHLVRSGIMRIRLIDFDQVTLSSLNRHAVAVRADVGTPKVQAMVKFFKKIFPLASVDARNQLFSLQFADELLSGSPDYVLDCIDNLDTKIELLKYCNDKGIQVISSMGSACKSDPSRVQIADISSTSEDPLARSVRYRLRKQGIESGLPVVFSTEKPRVNIVPLNEEAKSDDPKEFSALPNFRVRVLPVLGALPAIFGAAMASYVLCKLGNFSIDPIAQKSRHAYYQRIYKDVMKRFSVDDIGITLADAGYLVDEVWHGKSAFSGKIDHLVLVKWNNDRSLVLDNSVLMTREEAELHKDKSPADYDEAVRKKIEDKMKIFLE